MLLEIILPLLAVLALACTTMAGIFGVLYDYRDKETGRITKGGRIVLASTFFAGIIGTIATAFDAVKKRHDAEESNAKTLKVLTALNRNINSFQTANVTYALNVSWPELLAKFARWNGQPDCRSNYSTDTIIDYRDKAIRAIDQTAGVTAYLFRDIEKSMKLRGRECRFSMDCADAQLEVANRTSSKTHSRHAFDYDPCGNGLVIKGGETGTWRGNGRILSIPDLIGSTIVVIASGQTSVTDEPAFDSVAGPNPVIARVSLTLGERLPLNLTKWTTREELGATYYSHQFTRGELTECCSSDLE